MNVCDSFTHNDFCELENVNLKEAKDRNTNVDYETPVDLANKRENDIKREKKCIPVVIIVS